MKKNIITIGFFITIFIFMWMTVPAMAGEPTRPQGDRVLSTPKEAKIRGIQNLPVDEIFERLKSADFLVDEDLLNRAVFVAFHKRDIEAIEYALQYLQAPYTQTVNGRLVSRASELYVAKKIFMVFPDKATNQLINLYQNDDPVIRGNVIRVCGEVAGGKEIRNLLVAALDDKAVCEQEDLETGGSPLRVCDVAYNQLVLRYGIKKVQRTLGLSHGMETRDDNINSLKLRLRSQ